MTLPQGAARGPRSAPTRIGDARPSHLVTTTGVGAVVDLPSMSVVVRGLDAWSPEYAELIDEPRLLGEVRRVLGPQIRVLKQAPWDPRGADDPWSRSGVPVTPFPRWLRCPRCYRLGPIDPPGQFDLVHRSGRRPDLAKWVHTGCTQQNQVREAKKRACLPARFLVACDRGHLDDFPYVDYVHHGVTKPCAGPRLTMADAASTLGPRVQVKCLECDASRNIQHAAGRDGSANLPACRGRHPHLQRFETCGQPLRLMVLGSANLWFSVTASALHLPQGRSVADVVAAHWTILGTQANADVVQALIEGMDALRGLRGTAIDEVWKAIEQQRHRGTPLANPPTNLLDAEWQLLSRPTTERQDEDFRAVPTPSPEGYDRLLDQVVLVRRLREVQALVGFTRGNAPERREINPIGRVSLTRGTAHWVPAVEQRGEGVFLELREDEVQAWCERVREHPRLVGLRDAYRRWSANRDRPASDGFPIGRMLLLHTLSHLLIREVSLECGYSSASIRERLYLGEPDRPTAGILLSTAASDSEGTLGGLVALGEARHLKRLLDEAVEGASRCSSDPLCAEHGPQYPSETLHNAACHACLFASETSCESNNRWLDRAVLVDLTGGDGLAFLR